MRAKKVQDTRSVMTEMVMPNDANPMGNLMGGNLMRWMDIVASIAAGKHCEKHVVTASVDNVSFKKAIHVGDVVTLTAVVTRTFNSSLEVYVEVFAADIKGHDNRKCNNAYFTFVALDDETKRPTPIPGIIPLSDEEQRLFDGAERRREIRLILGGRLKPEDANATKAFFTDFNN